MKEKINTYLAILLITIIGSGATLIIVHIGTTEVTASAFGERAAEQMALRQSMLKNR